MTRLAQQAGDLVMRLHLDLEIDALDEVVEHAVSVGAELVGSSGSETCACCSTLPAIPSASTSMTRPAQRRQQPRYLRDAGHRLDLVDLEQFYAL